MTGIVIRTAAIDDAPDVASIYAHYVLHGTATFDTDPPSEEHWRAKIADVLDRGWPFLVADSGRAVAGYAYATQFRDRAAYAHTCENSIYVRDGQMGRGIGARLLAQLIESAEAAGFGQMVAVISDESASVPLHARAGFRHAGRMHHVGLKFGRWIDTVYMQRTLGDAGAEPSPG